MNLLSNAFKFTPSGGSIQLTITENDIPDQVNKTLMSITVKDSGCGMSKEYMNRIFKPFEQESALTAKEHGGSGLGLSITKSLIEMMGGEIRVESEEGVGTTFIMDIPFDIAMNSMENISPEDIATLKTLVVDDDEDAIEYASNVMERLGVAYNCVNSGGEAIRELTKARNDGNAYDVCLIDWRMGDMDGGELTKRIRTLYNDDVVVIVITAYDINEIGELAERSGADACVEKPLFPSTIFNILMTRSNGRLFKKRTEEKDYDFTGKNILLVDDTEMNVEIAEELLSMVGFKVDVARDGKEAVDKFLASKNGTYDAILMDVQMPVMNGYDATKLIRSSSHPQAKDIIIIAMTANAFVEDINNSLNAGMNDHISKPIDTDLMYQVLDRWFNSDEYKNTMNKQ